MADTQQLLAEYVKNGSEAAFHELVTRYVDLVYSAAVRLVNDDIHLAEDVTQTVFADLARMARTLSRDVMLGGWLHRHTCFVASNIMRSERRRQNRERQALEMNSFEDHSEANLKSVAPVLDEAINQLGTDDRQAILLRFFEQRDFRAVGEALGSTEEGARKRVSRALEKLEMLLKNRGVAFSAAALATALSTQAVTAAPVGIVSSISATALASAAAAKTAFTFTEILELMSMKLKAGIIGAVVIAVAIPLAMQQQDKNKLREENEALRQQVAQISKLTAENERLSNLVAQASTKTSQQSTNEQFREVLKLRGEVGKLRTAISAPKTNGPSMLSGILSNPEMVKMIRDQNKAAYEAIYKNFGKDLNLASEQMEKLNNLLTENAVESIGDITAILKDGKTREEVDALFTERDANLLKQVEELLGSDGFSEYQKYSRNIASTLTAEQFKGKLNGTKEEKEKRSKELFQLMLEESQAVLAAAGLDENFQLTPTLNFRNIASEEEGEKNLKLLSDVYERVANRAGSFLSTEELEKFGQFRTNALNQSRMALLVNRKMMAPAK